MKKMLNTISVFANTAVLCGLVGFGAFHWSEAKAQEKLASFTEEDIHCMQQNIYFEARDKNQSSLSRRAIAWVVLNRMGDSRWPDTICGVVWDNKQFSWTHDGKSDKPRKNEMEEWNHAGFIARSVLRQWAYEQESPVGDADHYHADYVTPKWAKAGVKIAKIDDHIFYEVKW